MSTRWRWSWRIALVAAGLGASIFGVDRARADAPPGYFQAANGVIIDTVTGLSWQAVPAPTTQTWSAAGTYCEDLELGGFDDWRLPTLLELHSIIDSEGAGPELLDPLFTSGTVAFYWSSTADPHLPSHFTVDVRFDFTASTASASANTAIARCVRAT